MRFTILRPARPRPEFSPLVSLLALLALLTTAAWYAGELRGRSLDASMRERLLRQAVDIADGVNPDLARRLSFTPSDARSSSYQQLREQLTLAARSFPHRGIYTMALRGGRIYFGPEDYDPSDPMASGPGSLYAAPDPSLLAAFRTGRPHVEGPHTDEYGRFVTAVAPVVDPVDGQVVMAVGIDVLADDWDSRLAEARLAPLLAALATALVIAAAVLLLRRFAHRAPAEGLGLRRRVLVPAALGIVAGLALIVGSEYASFRAAARREAERAADSARREWSRQISAAASLLQAEGDRVVADTGIADAFFAGDVPRLFAATSPVLERMRRDARLTHLGFYDVDRVCVLRVHDPTLKGDVASRPVILSAARTGEDARGMELGHFGAYTLRVVKVWKRGGATAGFVELAAEVGPILDATARMTGIDTALLVRKDRLDRARFEEGRRLFGYTGSWDAFPTLALEHQTSPFPLQDLVARLERDGGLAEPFIRSGADGHEAFSEFPLVDAEGAQVARLVLRRDVTAFATSALSDLAFDLALAAALFGGLVVLLSWATAGAEKRLQASFAKLRESEERHRQLTETMQDVVWALDPGTLRFLYVSPSVERLRGFTAAEVMAEPFDAALAGAQRAGIRGLLLERAREYAAGERRYHTDVLEQPRKGGGTVWTEVVSAFHRDEATGRLEVRGVTRDITARKLVEDELEESRARLLEAQKMEAIGRLAGGLAHDFNNLLQALLSLATSLRLRVRSPELEGTVAEIEAHVRRGAVLTQRLLLFSRQEIAQRRPVDLGATVARTCEFLRRLMPENVRLDVDAPAGLAWIEGDPGQVEQLLMNLALNANDAVAPGGLVAVRVGVAGAEAMLEVTDDGHGMDAATRARIFEPFFTTKEPGRGTGLGLAVVQGIVKEYGGRIEVDSIAGAGSTFRLGFPAVAAPEPAALPAAAPAAPAPARTTDIPRGRGERVLLVEDEEGAREGMADTLDLIGYAVTAVASGEDAQALPDEPAPDLLLTDLVLPGIGGAELAQLLRRRWPRMRVVLMSGYTTNAAVRAQVHEGTVRFLQKPFVMADLASELRSALG